MGEFQVGDRVLHRSKDLFGRIEAEARDHGPGHFFVKYEWPMDAAYPAQVVKAGELERA